MLGLVMLKYAKVHRSSGHQHLLIIGLSAFLCSTSQCSLNRLADQPSMPCQEQLPQCPQKVMTPAAAPPSGSVSTPAVVTRQQSARQQALQIQVLKPRLFSRVRSPFFIHVWAQPLGHRVSLQHLRTFCASVDISNSFHNIPN